MTPIRRLAILALGLTYVHSVFGAIVRISGSGMGCGEHWPDCNGAFLPAASNYTVAVEIAHRYLAAALVVVTLVVIGLGLARRREPGVAGPGGVLRPAVLALALEVTAALVGRAVVLLALANPYLIAVHYTIAMAILATWVVAVHCAHGLGAGSVQEGDASPRTYRGAVAAAALAFVTVVFGALTANVPGAAQSCLGFPWCRLGVIPAGGTAAVQLAHRGLATLLLLHLTALTVGVTRRHEGLAIRRALWIASGVIVAQVVIAALLVEQRLPAPLQSLHQATGTLLWVAVFAVAALARRARLAVRATGAAPAAVPSGVAA